MPEPLRLPRILERLRTCHGAPPAPFPTEPFEQILWENVAYQANDRRRLEAFEGLRQHVGTHPGAILAAGEVQLDHSAPALQAQQLALKLHQLARIALDQFGGDLEAVVRQPPDQAKRCLQRFPGVGEPAAERILLFARRQPLLAPDCNAVRVLARLGLCREHRDYAASYAEARDAAQAQLGQDLDGLIEAHQLLRLHGQTLCRHTAPECQRCPLAPDCAYAGRHPPAGGRG